MFRDSPHIAAKKVFGSQLIFTSPCNAGSNRYYQGKVIAEIPENQRAGTSENNFSGLLILFWK